MIKDAHLTLSEAQALTATAASTNVIDLTKAGAALAGAELTLVIKTGTLFASAGASTLVIAVETDSDVAFGTKTVLAETDAIAKASLTANKDLWKIKLPISKLGVGLQRYLRLYYTVAVADFTAGTLEANLVADAEVR